MKISEIHIHAHDLPVKDGPYTIASSTVWTLQTTLALGSVPKKACSVRRLHCFPEVVSLEGGASR